MPPAFRREKMIALRARRQSHQIAREILYRPIDLKTTVCPSCKREMQLTEFDHDGYVDCECGQLVRLPAHLACYLPPYASIICVACGAWLHQKRIDKNGGIPCLLCNAWTLVPREVALPMRDPDLTDFVLPTFPEEPPPPPFDLRLALILSVLAAVVASLIVAAIGAFH